MELYPSVPSGSLKSATIDMPEQHPPGMIGDWRAKRLIIVSDDDRTRRLTHLSTSNFDFAIDCVEYATGSLNTVVSH